jgi:electron transfer flavoprotein beta subunit
MAELNICALVSIGAHPTSGRPRRAEQDAKAVELGIDLAGDNLQLVHAGDPADETLRAYLGMGPGSLTVLAQPADTDALPALCTHLKNAGAHIVLTGTQAETGEGSGLLPYLLAEHLGWPLVVGLAEVETVDNGIAQVLQALPRGQRRRLRVRLPFVASVDNAGPVARQSAFGPARRGVVNPLQGESTPDLLYTDADWAAARARPKRLKVITAKTGAERMKAATAKAAASGGQVMTDVTPEVGAEAIFKLLLEEGVIR